MPIPYPRMGGRQVYTGEPMTTDVFNLTRPTRGQLSPAYQEQWQMQHGRELAGFGAVPDLPRAMGEPDWMDQALPELEEEDDSNGSGIFDPAGTSTVHKTMGVFQDHPAVPGYIARNPPYTINKEVRDITDDADVVEVAGGGLFYVERGGHLVGPPPGPKAPPQPRLQLGPPTGTDQPYMFLNKQAPAPLGAYSARRERPRAPMQGYGHFPQVPWAPTQQRVPPSVSIVNVANRQVAIGQDAAPQSAGWGSYLFAGALVGAAAALLAGTLGKKKGR